MTRITRIDTDFLGFIRNDPPNPCHPRSIDTSLAADHNSLWRRRFFCPAFFRLIFFVRYFSIWQFSLAWRLSALKFALTASWF